MAQRDLLHDKTRTHSYAGELYIQSVSQNKFYLQTALLEIFFSLFSAKVNELTNRKFVGLWNCFIGENVEEF